jgi:hypothetical protein
MMGWMAMRWDDVTVGRSAAADAICIRHFFASYGGRIKFLFADGNCGLGKVAVWQWVMGWNSRLLECSFLAPCRCRDKREKRERQI